MTRHALRSRGPAVGLWHLRLCAHPALACVLVVALAVAGCAAPVEVDWRYRASELDMRASSVEGVVGQVTVAGRIDDAVVTPDALWLIGAAPTRRSLPVHRVMRIDLKTNHFRDVMAVGGFAAGAIAFDGNSLWVAEGLGGDKVLRLDPASERMVATIAVAKNPVAVAAGAGAVWVLAAAHASAWSVRGLALYKIDPTTHRVAEPTIVSDDDAGPPYTSGSLTIEHGSVWVATTRGDILRVDPARNAVFARIPAPETADHAAWFRLVNSRGQLRLERRVQVLDRSHRAADVGRTTFWPVDPSLNRLGGELADFQVPGLLMFLAEKGCWIGSTKVDRLQRCDPVTLAATGAPRTIGAPVYGLREGQGTLWAFSGAGITEGDQRDITWITRLVP